MRNCPYDNDDCMNKERKLRATSLIWYMVHTSDFLVMSSGGLHKYSPPAQTFPHFVELQPGTKLKFFGILVCFTTSLTKYISYFHMMINETKKRDFLKVA